MPTRAVIYARLSVTKKTDGEQQEQSDSIENQVAAGVAAAQREGYDLVDTYKDDGISGYKGLPRPDFSRMLADLSKNKFDLVLVRHDDRLHRNDEEDFMWRAGCVKHGVRWQTFTGNITDPSTAQGALMAKIIASIGQFESQIKTERLVMKYAQMRADGDLLPHGFGWGNGGKKNLDQADHVTWMFDHLAKGGSVGAIVQRMNDLAVPQARGGKKWQHGTITAILNNPKVAGLVPDGSGGVLEGVKGNWDKLVESDVYEAAHAAWKARRPTSGPRNNFSTRHLLGGIAVCGQCGHVLRSNGNADDRTGLSSTGTYRCDRNRYVKERDGLRHVSARVDELDELARRALVAAFTFGTGNLLPAVDESVRTDLVRVNNDIIGLTARKQELLAMTREQDLGITLADVKPELRDLAQRAEQLDAERQVLQQKSAAAGMLTDLRDDVWKDHHVNMDALSDMQKALRERLDAMHIEQQRDLVRHFLGITVMPGRGAKKYVIEHKIVTSLNDDEQDFAA